MIMKECVYDLHIKLTMALKSNILGNGFPLCYAALFVSDSFLYTATAVAERLKPRPFIFYLLYRCACDYDVN